MAGREKDCKWYFSDQPVGLEAGPNNPMEQGFKRQRYSSLVRESIQNSLDAVLDKSAPVIVKYDFDEMNGADYPEFFKLHGHIQGCLDYFSDNRNAKEVYGPMLKWFNGKNRYQENIGFIRISDYNTTGMGFELDTTSNSFYAFVRSAGVSSKESSSAGGSFGFGKAAYFLISPINTILISTCTTSGKRYFEGISSLCTHTYNGVKKVSTGYYDTNDGYPVEEYDDIPVRFRRDEPGTDFNIMGFDPRDKEEAVKEIKEAVLRNFWMAILSNRLSVVIDKTITITRDNIVDVMNDTFPEKEDNSKWGGHENPRPYFETIYMQGKASNFLSIEDKIPLLGHVKLYVNKCKSPTDKIAYMRGLQMLVETKNNKTNYGLYAVFYCDDPEGNVLLRHLESAEHNQWRAQNWQVAGRTHPTARQVLKAIEDFIGNSLTSLLAKKNKEVLNIKGLEEFLYIPTAYDEDEDLESEALVGKPTGKLKEEGSSYTTDIEETDGTPNIVKPTENSSTGTVVINKPSNATQSETGKLKSGRTDKPKDTTGPGLKKTGNESDSHEEDENGDRGIYATPISIPYRTFSQNENGSIYHYVVLHSEEDIENVRLRFFAVGEDDDMELAISEVNQGVIEGHCVQNVYVVQGRSRLRIRFTDNMKHALKLTAEELHEV
jgi:hypothetical protein